VVPRQSTKAVLASDAPATNPVTVVQQLVQRLDGDRARIVRLALRLLDDDLELAAQLRVVDQRIAKSISLNVEGCPKTARWNDGIVQSVVVDGGRVQVAADGFRLPCNLAHAPRRRAFEVHVFEHVRDANDVVCLIEIACGHVRHDRRHGGCRIPTHEDA
jgi:hypothetical protein